MKTNGLKTLRSLRGWTQERAAAEADMSLGGYRKLEYGERELKQSLIQRLARVFDATEEQILGTPQSRVTQVPLVGYVGAGAEAHYYTKGDNPDSFVDAPDGATPETVAVEIRGTSLGELFDRWIVFYDEVRSPITSDLLGRLCVVGLPDDKVLVKLIRKSKTPGLYHLLSNTEPPLLDQEVDWAARVKSMHPR